MRSDQPYELPLIPANILECYCNSSRAEPSTLQLRNCVLSVLERRNFDAGNKTTIGQTKNRNGKYLKIKKNKNELIFFSNGLQLKKKKN